MKLLVFDTETTGLPKSRNAPIHSTELWPHVIQLSYILYDTEQNTLSVMCDRIIRVDDNVIISDESTKIHGITKTMCIEKGIPILDALHEFQEAFKQCDVVIAHNIEFDKNMLKVEQHRNPTKKPFWYNPEQSPVEHCTMKSNKKLCNIIAIGRLGDNYIKFPTLSELYKHLFNTTPNNTHNAFVDILICLRCYYHITYKEDLCFISNPFKKLFKQHKV